MRKRNRLGKHDTIDQSIEKLTARIESKQKENNHATGEELALELTALFMAKAIKRFNDRALEIKGD